MDEKIHEFDRMINGQTIGAYNERKRIRTRRNTHYNLNS